MRIEAQDDTPSMEAQFEGTPPMTSIPEIPELRECPFDGSQMATYTWREQAGTVVVECRFCGARTNSGETEAEVAELWNRRRLAPDTSAPADVGELIERAHAMLAETRNCTVCDGDGIKDSGKDCGGCDATGKVLRLTRTDAAFIREAADALARLSRAAPAGDEVVADDAMLDRAIETWPKPWEEYNLREALKRAVSAALSSSQAEIAELRRERDEWRGNYHAAEGRKYAMAARAESAEQALEAAAAERDRLKQDFLDQTDACGKWIAKAKRYEADLSAASEAERVARALLAEPTVPDAGETRT